MNSSFILILCAFIWGCTTFLQRLAADKMSPILMQVVVGTVLVMFMPIAFKLSPSADLKWSWFSIGLTFIAAIGSLLANIFMYSALKGNQNTGSSVMLISLYPVVTLMLSAIFLHEQFTVGKILGVASMIIGALLLSLC